jgi:hypothetical protein
MGDGISAVKLVNGDTRRPTFSKNQIGRRAIYNTFSSLTIFRTGSLHYVPEAISTARRNGLILSVSRVWSSSSLPRHKFLLQPLFFVFFTLESYFLVDMDH